MKQALIIVSASYFILSGLLIEMQVVQSLMVRISALLFQTPLVLVALWLQASGIGIALRKNWARMSLLVFSSLAAFLGLAHMMLALLMSSPRNSSAIPSLLVEAIYWIVIPVLLLVFFSRSDVKENFVSGPQVKGSLIDVGMACLIAFLMFGALSFISWVMVKHINSMNRAAQAQVQEKCLKACYQRNLGGSQFDCLQECPP